MSLINRNEIIPLTDIRNAQITDEDINVIIEIINKKHRQKDLKNKYLSDNSKLLIRELSKLFIDEQGMLRRRCGKVRQLVLLKSFKHMIYSKLHSDMGHLGTERVYQLAKQKVYWPHMHADIEKYIKEQCSCVVQKKQHIHQEAPLQSIHSSSPMELVAIDYLHL